MKELTQIQVKKKTRELLKQNKLVSKESYDEIINRILVKHKSEKR